MANQIRLAFGRLDSPAGVVGDFMSDLIGGSNLQPALTAVFYSAFARSWFTSVAAAYDIKSSGGIDDLGIKWEDLTIKTKAYDRPDLRNTILLPNISPHRPTLTAQQDREWRAEYVYQLEQYPRIEEEYESGRQRAFAFLVQVEDERRAHSRAAAYAWAEVKEKWGAKTLLDLLGLKKASLLRVTDRLRNSYEPGEGTPYTPPADQVFKPLVGGLELGSSVPYAGPVAKKRPIQPRGTSVWARRALRDGLDAVRQRLSA